MIITGSVSKTPIRGKLFYLSCISGIYLIWWLWKLASVAIGYQRVWKIKNEDSKIVIEDDFKLLGIKVSSAKGIMDKSALKVLWQGSEGDPGILVVGVAFLFYASLWGVTKIFNGLLASEPSLIFWGIGLIVAGFLIDATLFTAHWFVKKKNGRVYIVKINDHESYKISNTQGDLSELIE
jgi:hypothetical protein